MRFMRFMGFMRLGSEFRVQALGSRFWIGVPRDTAYGTARWVCCTLNLEPNLMNRMNLMNPMNPEASGDLHPIQRPLHGLLPAGVARLALILG